MIIALVPIGVAAARALHDGWIPVSENALYAIRARDVFTHHIPLVGTLAGAAGTRLSNQPGALLFDVLAVPVTVLGGSTGVVVGVSLINAASVVGIAVLAYRRGGSLVATVAMAVASGLAWAMGSTMLLEPWNPHSVLLPFLCVLMLVWSVACGDVSALPFLVFTGSFVVQTHLSYVLLVPVLCVWAVVGLALRLRGNGERLARHARRTIALAGIVMALCWTQPIIEQFTSDGAGNLTRLATSADGSGATVGYSEGTRLVADVVGLPPWWLRPSFRRAFVEFEGWRPPSATAAVASLAIVGAALAWCAWDARRRDDRVSSRLVATAAIALAVGLLTAGRAPLGQVAFLRISPHVLRWLWPLAAFLTFTLAVVIARRWALDHRGVRWSVNGAVLATAIFAMLNFPASTQSLGPSQNNAVIPAVRALNRLMGSLASEGPLLADDLYRLGVGDAWSGPVLAELQRREIPFVVEDEGLVRQFGDGRRFDGTNARAALLIRVGDAADATPSGARRVARHDGITANERRDLATLEPQIVEHVRARGLPLNDRGERALERGDLPVLRSQDAGDIDPAPLFETRELARMIREDFVVLDDTWKPRYERYANLVGRADTMTVALFVRPVGP